MRSSTRQLNRFLPLYRETVGVHPEDVYGVFPWGRASQSGTESTSTSGTTTGSFTATVRSTRRPMPAAEMDRRALAAR
jgi:hypothetical protein